MIIRHPLRSRTTLLLNKSGTMIAMENSIPAQVDKVLSLGPFGNNKSLAFNVRTLYVGIQKIVNAALGIDVGPKMSLSSPVAQVLTRATLDEVFVLLKNNSVEKARQKVNLLEEYSTNLLADTQTEEFSIFPEQELHPLSDLNSNEFLRAIACRVREAFIRDGFTSKVELVEPTKLHYKNIEDGKALLTQLIPHVSSSTLSLVRCLLLVNGAIGSAYFNETPFMYVVGITGLSDPLQIANTLLHEALHQKMADIRLTRRILCEDYNDLDSTTSKDLLIPWGASSPRVFSVSLGLAAYHFYVHSALVHASALEHLPNNTLLQSIDGEKIVSRLVLAFERAAYLETRLRSNAVQKKMGSDGVQFMTLMGDAMIQLQEVRLLNGTELSVHRQLEFSSSTA
ncbi:hypothetical protein [Microcoleus sp. herbarium14]|uniref:hypothetical protein n=1 Tax=Microcoleus sp. herbarium14 TaxID=3055439 RepID=UPI002FD45360